MSTNVPTFSLAYTTVRPGAIPNVVALWNSRSKLKTHEWVFGVDDGDETTLNAAKAAFEATFKGGGQAECSAAKVIVNTGANNCVAGWNTAAAHTVGKIIIAVPDDFVPPQDWDEALLSVIPDIDAEFVVHVNDGFIGHLFTLAILSRKRYEKFGYLFYPAYESMFCDTEFGDVAIRDGVNIEAMHLLFEHMHPACGKRVRDQADMNHENQPRWDRGQMLYNYRKARNFPLDAGPKAEVSSVNEPEKRTYCAYLQVNRDDLCLFEVCERLHQEGVRDFFFSVPDEYWDGRKTSLDDMKAIKVAADRLKNLGLTVNTKIYRVASYRFQGDMRVDTETRLRNDSLAWIRANGFKHILIVDGDELWKPGTLNVVDELVSAGHIAISSQMVPVVGLPGYPVDQATDVAVVYIGGNCQFKCCRTPFAQQTVISRPLILHFTGTRRTMEEIIAKHRTSGHYDDPDYDFEGWIKNILPNIKPGLQNVHMYRKYQIWPRIRDWRPEEVAALPESLFAYLPADVKNILNA